MAASGNSNPDVPEGSGDDSSFQQQMERMSLATPDPASIERPASSCGLGSAAKSLSIVLDEVSGAQSHLDRLRQQVRNQEEMQSMASVEEEQYGRSFSALSTRPTTAGVANSDARSHEREVEIAELETRIRSSNLDLFQPTIRKTTIMEQELAEMRAELARVASTVQSVKSVSTKVEEQVINVESFREQMANWEVERRAVQTHVAETIANMTQDLDNFRFSLERKDSSIHSIQRTMDRLVGELSKNQEGNEALRQHVELRLAQSGKVLNGAKTDLECKLIALETKHNKIADELWGEETFLASAAENIQRTNDLVIQLSEEMKRMQHDKANVTQLEAVQDDVNELIRDANANVTMLKQTVDTMVNDVKKHFQTATETVAAHNATMLGEVRTSYQEELSKVSALRSEVKVFMEETRTNIERIQLTADTSQDLTSEMVKKVSDEVTELNRCRKQDNSNLTLSGQTMKQQITQVSSSSESVTKIVEHLGEVVKILLKSERVSSALAQQENIDRAKVALMGYRDAKGTAARPTSQKAGRRSRQNSVSAPSDTSDSGEAVISVDNRCLSCSGQAQHVLSGFKMACLQYAPGPVTFSSGSGAPKKLYKREELLDLRQRLLEQAQEQLQQGPAGNLGDFASSANRSNLHRELESSPSVKLPVDLEAFDRPGSQSSHGSGVKPRALPPLAQDELRPLTAR